MYTLELYKNVDVQRTYDNVRWFSTLNSQTTYFTSKISNKILNNSPIKNTTALMVGVNIEQIRDIPYACFYADGGKRMYVFVDSLEYINDNLTQMNYTIDSIQTYMFELSIDRCFVEREHVTDDSIGANVVDEGLGVGYYVDNKIARFDEEFANSMIVVGSTKSLDDGTTDVSTGYYNGVYRGYKYYSFSGVGSLSVALDKIIENGNIDAIIEMFMTSTGLGARGTTSAEVNTSTTPRRVTQSISKLTTLDGYTPRNKKLLIYPFVQIEVSNGVGDSVVLQQELFNGTPNFELLGVLNSGVQYLIAPTNYTSSQNTKQLSINPYPSLSWNNDPYQTWLSQNNYSYASDMLAPVVSGAIGGAVIGNVGGAIIGALGGAVVGAMGSVAQGLDLSNKPTRVSNAQNATYIKKPTALIRTKSITADLAKTVDDYFTMYGYRVNRYKVPNLTTHTNFNYVKLSQCTFTGNIPSQYMEDIINAFTKGITLWHTTITRDIEVIRENRAK